MSNNTPLKDQAKEIMVAIDRDLQEVETESAVVKEEVNSQSNFLLDKLFGVINDVDIEAAAQRVAELRQKHPEASPAELSQILIREKSTRTGTVGAVTSGAGLIPGLGTAAAMTLGVAADIGATFKLQAELVLEIAAAYNYPLTENEKQQIVMVITGISAGTSALTRRAGQAAAIKVGERLATQSAQKAFTKALPVVGVLASAGTNVLSTYIIGQRADAYFRLGPEAVGSWADSLRAISGVDERNIAGWLADSGRAAGSALLSGAEMVGDAGKVAGGMVSSGAGKVAETVGPALSSGTQRVGKTAQSGLRAYLRWLVTFWSVVIRGVGKGLGFLWAVVAFVPRKIMGMFRK